MYSIIDIETTGNGIKGNRITEISIFNFDGTEVVDEFTSLVNPECPIPQFITGLTGIDDNMVRNAPKWEEIADTVLEMTQNTIFVAHSVNFDYNVIKNEFENLGIIYVRKKLCTVRLSRKLIPGFNSYSLGKLCSALNIPLTDRHRARGDAHATVLLFKRLLDAEGANDVFKTFLNSRSQEATLPPGLPKEVFDKLPNAAGVYYFKDENGNIIYIGKAINIKKRVLGHFYNKSNKENLLCKATHDIDYELSGSELVALLMESHAIKQHYPKFNVSQKRNTQEYAIFTYEDRNGIIHLAYNNAKMVMDPICTFNNITECRFFLEDICQSHNLCPKFCHLQENTQSCSHFSLSSCQGICRGKEVITDYNERVEEAIEKVKEKNIHILITEKGRQPNENAFVLITDGQYKGFGFIQKSEQITSLEVLETYLERKKENLDTKRIIAGYLKKFPHKSMPLPLTSI
ncbi:exonuclease domain-containing protein [Arenibacter certesii]|uniref:Excinuclease cho n=1 Tax=Arenibacter certesii TaxID=228955 RepID=A0A918IP26_9FLAO|nr:exonuclease domain-containing protein [Arenibacter certesii]GGW23484.1 exonuclease [Arenibacter certesii]